MSRSIVSSVPSRLALPSRGHELGGPVEPHAQPHVDRLHAQPDREMCLSAPGLAVEHQVLCTRDETESQEPARGWVARCLPDESRTPGLERAEAHDRLSARVRPVRGTAMPSPGAATPYRSAFICRHAADVETLPGQRRQRRTVLGEQATFLRVLAAVRFRGQLQAPVRQPGAEVLQAPYARPGHEQLAPHHTRPWTPPRPSHDRNTGCPTSNRTRNAPGRPGTGTAGRGSRSPYPLWPTPAALSNTIRLFVFT